MGPRVLVYSPDGDFQWVIWVAVRDTIGHTIVVRTVSGGTMGRLSSVEEISIGQLDGRLKRRWGLGLLYRPNQERRRTHRGQTAGVARHPRL